MIKNFFRMNLSVFIIVLSFVSVSFAQTVAQKDFSNIKIKNFGQMDEHFYRGAQPKEDDYQSLVALGVKTVIDLQETPKGYEKSDVEALGMKYVNIPMNDKTYPKPENVELFLKLINDPSNGVFYVHCAGGRHRTGVMGAVYRFTKYGWNFDQVYAEMKKYDFYSSWGHQAMQDFVVDYAKKLNSEPTDKSATQAKIR